MIRHPPNSPLFPSTPSFRSLLREPRPRRQIRRDARRLILRSKLFPPLAADALRDVWKRSGRGDKELIEEVLVGMCASAADELKATIERSVVGSGIFERWISDVRNGGPSTRVRAATRLGYVHDLRGVFELARATEDGSLEVRMAAVLGLGRLQDPRGLLALVTIASKPSSEIPDFTDRKSTRLNSSHLVISYAVFCLKKKKPSD